MPRDTRSSASRPGRTAAGVLRAGRSELHGILVRQVGELGVGSDVDPAQFVLMFDAQADGALDDLCDDPSDHERVGKHSHGGDGLDAQKVETTAVEQAGHAVGGVLGGQEPDQQGSEDATDEVDADDVEGIIETEPELQLDREGTDGSGARADDQGAYSTYGSSGRCDGDE